MKPANIPTLSSAKDDPPAPGHICPAGRPSANLPPRRPAALQVALILVKRVVETTTATAAHCPPPKEVERRSPCYEGL